jgi:hypothetical protein
MLALLSINDHIAIAANALFGQIWRGVLKSQPHRNRHGVCHLLFLVLALSSAGSYARANAQQLPHPAAAATPQSEAPQVPAAQVPQIPGIPSTTPAAAPTPPPAPVF